MLQEIKVKETNGHRLENFANRARVSVGGMENELAAARLALQDMIATAAANEPGFGTTNRVMIGNAGGARSAQVR